MDAAHSRRAPNVHNPCKRQFAESDQLFSGSTEELSLEDKINSIIGKPPSNIETLLNAQPRKLRSFLSPVQAARNKDNKLDPSASKVVREPSDRESRARDAQEPGDPDTTHQIHQILVHMQSGTFYEPRQPHPSQQIRDPTPIQQIQQPHQPHSTKNNEQPRQIQQESLQTQQMRPTQTQQTQTLHTKTEQTQTEQAQVQPSQSPRSPKQPPQTELQPPLLNTDHSLETSAYSAPQPNTLPHPTNARPPKSPHPTQTPLPHPQSETTPSDYMGESDTIAAAQLPPARSVEPQPTISHAHREPTPAHSNTDSKDEPNTVETAQLTPARSSLRHSTSAIHPNPMTIFSAQLQRYQEQHKLAMHQASLLSRSQEFKQLPKANLQPKLPDCVLQIQLPEESEQPRPLPHPQPPPQPLSLPTPQKSTSSPHVHFQDRPDVKLIPKWQSDPPSFSFQGENNAPHENAIPSPHAHFQDRPDLKSIPKRQSDLPSFRQKNANANIFPLSFQGESNAPQENADPNFVPFPGPALSTSHNKQPPMNSSQPLPPPKLQVLNPPQNPSQISQQKSQTPIFQNNDFQQRKFEQQFQMQLNKHQNQNNTFPQNTNIFSQKTNISLQNNPTPQNISIPVLHQSQNRNNVPPNLFSSSLPQPSKPADLPRKSLSGSTSVPPSSPSIPLSSPRPVSLISSSISPPISSSTPSPIPFSAHPSAPRLQLFPPSLRNPPAQRTPQRSLSPAHSRATPSPKKEVSLLPKRETEIFDACMTSSNGDTQTSNTLCELEVKGPSHTLASLAADQMRNMTRITQLVRVFHLKRILALYRRAQELRMQLERQGALHDKYTILPASNYPPISKISEKWGEVQRYPFVGKAKKQRELIAGSTMKKNSYNKGSHERDAMVSDLDFTKAHADEMVRDGVRQWEGTQFKASLVQSLYEKYMKKIVVLSLRLAVQRRKLRDHMLSWKNGDGQEALVREAFRGWLALCPYVPIFGELKAHLTRFKRMWWLQKWKSYVRDQRTSHNSVHAAVRHAARARKRALFARWRQWALAQRAKTEKIEISRNFARFSAVRGCFRRWVGFVNHSMSLKSKLLSIAFGEREIPRKIALAPSNSASLHNFLSRRSLQDISRISPGRSRAFDLSRSALFSSFSRTPPSSPPRNPPTYSTPSPPRSPPLLGFAPRVAPARMPFVRIPPRLALSRNARFLEHADLLSALTRNRAHRHAADAERPHAGEDHASLALRAQRRAMLGKAWVTWCRAMYWKHCEEMGGIFREVSVLTKCVGVWKRKLDERKRKVLAAEEFHRKKSLARFFSLWKRGTRAALAVWKRGIVWRWRKFVEISKAKKRRLRLAQDFARVVTKQNIMKAWRNYVDLRKKHRIDRSKLDSFCESRDNSVAQLRNCWAHWTKKLHARQLLRRVISRAAQKWKERLSSHSKYLEQYNTAQKVFRAWQDRARARVLKRKLHALSVAASAFYKRKLVKTPFRSWLQWWHQKKRIHDCGLKVRANHNRHLERSAFKTWRGGNTDVNSSLQQFHAHWHYTRPLYIAFSEWRAFAREQKRAKAKTGGFARKFQLSKAFQIWQVFVYRRIATREASSELQFRKLSSLFSRWRLRMRAKLDDVMDEMLYKMEARELQFKKKRELEKWKSELEAYDSRKKFAEKSESVIDSPFLNYSSDPANATFDREVESIFQVPSASTQMPTKVAAWPRVPLATFLAQPATAQNLALATVDVAAQAPAAQHHASVAHNAISAHAQANRVRKSAPAKVAARVRSPARVRASFARSPARERAQLVLDNAHSTIKPSHTRSETYTHVHKTARTPPRRHASASPKRAKVARSELPTQKAEREAQDAEREEAQNAMDISAIMRAELARQEKVKRKREERRRKEREEKEAAEKRREERERREGELRREIERLRAANLMRTQERLEKERGEAVESLKAREVREEEERVDLERDKRNELKLVSFLDHKRHLAHEEDAKTRVHSLRGLSLHELFVLMKCLHAFKIHTRNKRIKRVLKRKAQAMYERNLLLHAMRTWGAQTVRVTAHTQAIRVGDLAGAQYVRLKGHVGAWQRALRTPLRSVSAPVVPAQDFASDFSKISDLAVDQDNRLYRRVVENNRIW